MLKKCNWYSYAFRQINEKINLLESTKQTEISDKVESLELVDFKITNCSYVNSKHINFLVSLGETLVIQGESGVGKSSFLSLMLGKKFTYDGNILINHRVLDPTMFSLKNNIAYVPQQVHIMRKSLLENITLTSDKSQIEPERLQQCLNTTGLDRLYKNKNFKNAILDPSKLSGGEITNWYR